MAKKGQRKAARVTPPPADEDEAGPSSGSQGVSLPKAVDALKAVGEHLAFTGSLDGRTRGALRGTCVVLRLALPPCARVAAADLVKITDGDFPESCVELRIDGRLKPEHAGYLVGADWATLESLRLDSVSDALPMLARKKFPKLRRLRIECIDGHNPNFEPLKRLKAAQLEELHVAGVSGGTGRGGAAVAARLATICTTLRRLSLRAMGLDHEAAEGILKIRSLRSVDLSDNRNLADGIGALVLDNEHNQPDLCELILEKARLKKIDLEKLRESEVVCRRVRQLALGLWTSEREEDAAEVPDALDVVSLLDAMGGNANLHELTMSLPRGVDAAGAFGNAALRALRTLRLTAVTAPAALFTALGTATLPALQTLYVAGFKVEGIAAPGTGTLEALIAEDALPRLENLTLRRVTLGYGAAASLRTLFSRLKVARLEAMSLTDTEMDHIFRSQRPKKVDNDEDDEEGEERWALEELSVSHNQFKSQGLAQLMAAAPYMPALRSLRVLHCKYSTMGTRFLLAAATSVFPGLTELGMDVNKDAGAVINEGWRWSELDALEFTHANVTEQAALREAFPGVRVTFA